MGVTVDPSTGALVGTPDAPAPIPDAQAAIDQVLGAGVLAAPQMAPMDPYAAPPAAADHAPVHLDAPTTLSQPVAPNSQLAALQAAMRGAPVDPGAASTSAGEVYDGTAPPQVQAPGASTSQSLSAYSPEVARQLENDPMALAQLKAWDEAKARAQQDGESMMAAAAAQADAQKRSEQQRWEAEQRDLAAQQAAIENHARAMQQAQAEHERRLADRNRSADAAKQQYMADAAAVRAMVSDPYANLRGENGAMALLAIAGHTWLANMGPGAPVQPNVPAMIDQIIQRTIDSQATNRELAQQGVEYSDHLWNLARQGVDDENLAYERYRGFLTEAYHTTVAVNAAKFAGPKAAAAHQAALDAITAANQEFANGIRGQVWNQIAQYDKNALDLLKNIQDNARMIREAQIAVGPQYKRIEAEAAKAGAVDSGVPILNPNLTRTGRVIDFSKFGKNVTETTKTAVLNKAQLAPQLYAAAQNVAEAYQKLGDAYAGKWGTLTATDSRAVAYQQALAAYKNVLKQWGNTGANLTDNEVENAREAAGAIDDNVTAIVDRLKSTVGMATPDYVKTIASGALAITSQVKAGLEQFARDETPEERATMDANGVGTRSGFSKTETVLGVMATPEEHVVDTSIAELATKASGKMAGNKRNPEMFKPDYARVNETLYNELKGVLGERDILPRVTGSIGVGPLTESITRGFDVTPPRGNIVGAYVPSFVAGAVKLWETAFSGKSDPEQASAALAQLKNLASDLRTGDLGSEPEAKKVARFLLERPYEEQLGVGG